MVMNEIPAGTTQLPCRRPRPAVYGDLRAVTPGNVSDNENDKGNGSASMT
jgi:hypothetical protein